MKKGQKTIKASNNRKNLNKNIKNQTRRDYTSETNIMPIKKRNCHNRSFIRLPKHEKIKILTNDLYREAYRLAEFLTAESSREGFAR